MSNAAKRSAMALFSDSRDHYSHRVRIVLAEKGVSVDVIAVDPRTKPAELAELNPYNTLPTLVDRDELALYEARVIMEYLDERFPHPPLLPVYPVARAKSRLWMYRLERDWSPLVDTILQGKSKEQVVRARADLLESFLTTAPIFAEKPFFMSDEFTMMDCCLGAILWRLPLMEISIPETRHSRPLLEYMARLFARDAFQASLSDQERDMQKV